MDSFENQMKSKDLCPKTCIRYKSTKSVNPLKISQGSKNKARKVFFFDKYGKLLKEMIFFHIFSICGLFQFHTYIFDLTLDPYSFISNLTDKPIIISVTLMGGLKDSSKLLLHRYNCVQVYTKSPIFWGCDSLLKNDRTKRYYREITKSLLALPTI